MQRTNLKSLFAALLLAGLFTAAPVQVQAQAQAPAQIPLLEAIQRRANAAGAESLADCTVATIPYKASTRTPIYLRAGKTVTLGFQADETIATVIWDEPKRGDFIEDFVHPDQRNLTVRTKNLMTIPGVVITSQRRYFLLLSPTEPGPAGTCYQGVIFSGSEGPGSGFNPFGTTVSPSGTAATSVSEYAPQARPSDDVFTGTPNFNYSITGDASFKPVAVYDNGRFTWIQMAQNVQILPAVFYSGPNGLEIVNYTPINNGTALVVNRLMEKIVLRVGTTEVTITANSLANNVPRR